MLKSRLDSRCSGLTDDQIRHGLGEKQKRTTVSLFTVLSVHNLFLKQVPITRGTDQVGGCVSILDTRYTAGDSTESERGQCWYIEGITIQDRQRGPRGQYEYSMTRLISRKYLNTSMGITSDGYTKQVAT